MPFVPFALPRPFEVTLLILPDFSLLTLAAVMEPLRAANRAAGQTLYSWRLVSHDGKPALTTSGISLPVEGPFEPAAVSDALIVMASFNVARHARAVLPALRSVGRRKVPIGGVEAGSWVLAQAGLLDGRRATTHWEDLETFAESYPRIEVVADRFVADLQRFTTGGATPALDMMLELIRAQHGVSLALDVARIFIYGQAPLAAEPQPIVSMVRLEQSDRILAEAVRLMETHIANPLPIPAIARRLHVSVRTLELKFKSHLATTPHNYFLDLRLNAARRMLIAPGATIVDTAESCGFGSASAFARAFRRRFARSPQEARRELLARPGRT